MILFYVKIIWRHDQYHMSNSLFVFRDVQRFTQKNTKKKVLYSKFLEIPCFKRRSLSTKIKYLITPGLINLMVLRFHVIHEILSSSLLTNILVPPHTMGWIIRFSKRPWGTLGQKMSRLVGIAMGMAELSFCEGAQAGLDSLD